MKRKRVQPNPLSVRIDPKKIAQLDRVAAQRGVTRNKLVVSAIERELASSPV